MGMDAEEYANVRYKLELDLNGEEATALVAVLVAALDKVDGIDFGGHEDRYKEALEVADKVAKNLVRVQ